MPHSRQMLQLRVLRLDTLRRYLAGCIALTVLRGKLTRSLVSKLVVAKNLLLIQPCHGKLLFRQCPHDEGCVYGCETPVAPATKSCLVRLDHLSAQSSSSHRLRLLSRHRPYQTINDKNDLLFCMKVCNVEQSMRNKLSHGWKVNRGIAAMP